MATAKDRLADYEKYAEQHRPTQKKEDPNKLDCSGHCSRVALLVMNVFFLMIGAVIIGVAAYTMNTQTDKIVSKQIPIGALVLGAVIIFISFLGCCGAKSQSRCLMFVYIVVLSALIIAQIVIASMLLANSSKADSWLRSGWRDASDGTRKDLQDNFGCCGLDEYDDQYAAHPCPTANGTDVPCLEKLKSDIKQKLNVLGGIGIAFAVFEILGILFACCLRNSISDRDKESAELEDAKKANRSYQT